MTGIDGLSLLGRQALQRIGRGGAADAAARARFAAGDAATSRTLDATTGTLFGQRQDRGGYQADAQALFVAQVFGSLSGMVGSFYAAQSAREQGKAQAQDLEFEQSMAGVSARLAMADANAILEAGRDEAAQASAEYGMAKAETEAQQGASGFVAGQGSGGAVLQGIELAKRIDVGVINRNAVRAASQRRLQATDLRSRGALAGASARNIRGAAATIQPGAAAVTSLLNSGSSLVGRYAALRSGRFQ